jgi:hypothetical protein
MTACESDPIVRSRFDRNPALVGAAAARMR